MYSDDHHIYTSGKHIHYVKSNLKKETDLASVYGIKKICSKLM